MKTAGLGLWEQAAWLSECKHTACLRVETAGLGVQELAAAGLWLSVETTSLGRELRRVQLYG